MLILPPLDCVAAGYSALVQQFDLKCPLIAPPSCVHHTRVNPSGTTLDDRDGRVWRLFGSRTAIENTVLGHIEFALKNEGVDLLVLKRVIGRVGLDRLDQALSTSQHPNSVYTRRAWFLVEWLTGEKLSLPDLDRGNYVDALDEEFHVTAGGINSARHKVRDNMPGTPGFCPIARAENCRQPLLQADDYRTMMSNALAGQPESLARRALSALQLRDSQASWKIEGESAPRDRLQRWAQETAQNAGRELSLETILKTHDKIIEGERFINRGFRKEGVFLGSHDQLGAPHPDFIGARQQDVERLVSDIVGASKVMLDKGYPPAYIAAAVSFGLVYVHPFEDGNGRLHRAVMQQMLVQSGAAQPSALPPLAARILDNLDGYANALRAHDARIMPFIEWRPTASGNVGVTNDTADFYRYFDAAPGSAFLEDQLQHAIGVDLPRELNWIASYDYARQRIDALMDIPSRQASLLISAILQNQGRLSGNKRKNMFAAMTDEEVSTVEEIIVEVFDIERPEPQPAADASLSM